MVFRTLTYTILKYVGYTSLAMLCAIHRPTAFFSPC